MSLYFRFAASIAALSPIALAAAQNAPDLADLVGARAAGAETQMEARGYRATGASTVRDTKFTFWWNNRKQACVSVSTVEGRYVSIQPVPPGNCDSGSSSVSPGQAVSASPENAGSLVLVCYGAGTRPTTTSTPQYRWNSDKQKWDWSTTVQSTMEGFSSDVQIEIYGDHGRIHLGPSLIPPIHSGGSNGWWDLDNLIVSPNQIAASYRLNGLNKPKITVDRRTGRIELRAITNFSGQCDIGDWSQGKRRF
ncbi:hypothetical protein [Sphingomonas sp.]